MKPAAAFIVEQRQGALAGELTEALAEAATAARDVGKPATVTVVIKFDPGKAGSLETTDKLTVKLPEADRGAALWFVDDDGNITERDPRQPSLPGIVSEVPPLADEDDADDQPKDGKSAAAGD